MPYSPILDLEEDLPDLGLMIREPRFDRGKTGTQRVILGILDRRCVLLVIEGIVVSDLSRDLLVLGRSLGA